MAIATLNNLPPARELLSPLDYIFADHFRQRVLCRILDELAESPDPDNDLAAAALRFLTTDFSSHVIDEEEDLFPLLRRRAQPEDGIEAVLGELSHEHATDKEEADQIIAGLTAAVAKSGRKQFTKALRSLLHQFSANERRHLIVENAIVLPLARLRLNADDLRNLGRRMAARRGIDYPDFAHVV